MHTVKPFISFKDREIEKERETEKMFFCFKLYLRYLTSSFIIFMTMLV